MTQLNLAVFDVDGTLIDSQDFIVEAMQRAFRALGMSPPSKPEILSIVGLSLEKAVGTLAPQLHGAELAEAAQAYKNAFIAIRAERGGEAAAPMYPGARDALDTLHGRDEVLLGVATGKARRGLDHAYQSHGIGHYFVTHQTADDHPSKPHPSMLERALYETGCDAGRAVMIGDTEFDIAMGRAAGFSTIGVTWGYHPVARLRDAGADHIVDSFEQLLDAVDRIWR